MWTLYVIKHNSCSSIFETDKPVQLIAIQAQINTANFIFERYIKNNRLKHCCFTCNLDNDNFLHYYGSDTVLVDSSAERLREYNHFVVSFACSNEILEYVNQLQYPNKKDSSEAYFNIKFIHRSHFSFREKLRLFKNIYSGKEA